MGDLARRIDHRFIRNNRFSRGIYGGLDRVRLLRWAVRPPRSITFCDQAAQPQPFFVVGSGRSGNTLMRLMLVEGGQVAIPPESYFLPTLYRRFSVLRGLPWDDVCRLLMADVTSYDGFSFWKVDEDAVLERACSLPPERHTLADFLDALYRTYGEQQSPGFERWGDKTPKNSEYLRQLDIMFPKGQFVHMLRDGRDVVLSYLQAGIYSDAEAAARFWVTSVRSAERYGKGWGPDRYHLVRYETLVTEPSGTLEAACRFLGIEYSDDMLEFWKKADSHGDTTEAHHRNLKNPVSTASIGKWRSGLDRDTLSRVLPIMQPDLERLGYLDG